jgi:hypothetical protein
LIHEHHVLIRTTDGPAYVARTYGVQQSDGTWQAWLEFDPVEPDAPVLRTERETGQASRQALDTWASGLETSYFQGAFARARVVGPASSRRPATPSP